MPVGLLVEAACGNVSVRFQVNPADNLEIPGIPVGPCGISSHRRLLSAAEASVQVKPGGPETVDVVLSHLSVDPVAL